MIEFTPETSVTLAFEGELESHNWEQFHDAIIDAVVDGTTVVVLDLGDVTFFDSSAVRALLGPRLALEPWHVTIAIGPCSEMARRVLEVTGLSEVFPTQRSSLAPVPPPVPRPSAGGSCGRQVRSRDTDRGRLDRRPQAITGRWPIALSHRAWAVSAAVRLG